MSCNCRFSTCRFGKGPSADDAGNFTAGASEYDLLVFAVVALYAQEPAPWPLDIIYHFILLLEFEFLCSECRWLVGFLAYCTAVSQPDAFCWLIAARHLGEFPTVSYALLSFFLSCNMGHGRSLALLDPFNNNFLMRLTGRAVSSHSLWNFHSLHLFDDYWYCSLPSPAFAGRAFCNIVLNVRMAFAYGVSFSGKHYLGSL